MRVAMRIAMLSPTLGGAFGQEAAVSLLTNKLGRRGHEVLWVGDMLVGDTPTKATGLGIETVSGLSNVYVLSSFRKVAALHGRVLRILHEFRPDIVHLHDQFDSRLIKSLARQFPMVFTAHSVAPTCPASTRFGEPDTICEAKSGWQCLGLSHTQNCLAFLRNELHRGNAILNYSLRVKWLSRYAHVIAISRYIERTLIRDGWPKERVHLIYNAIDLDNDIKPVHCEMTHGTYGLIDGLNEAPRLVVAARLVPLKGISYLIDALKRIEHRPWQLLICGEGPLWGALQKQVDTLTLTHRVRLLGKMNRQDTLSIMASSHCVVAPNMGPEGFGLSVAEASALGVSVVAFDTPAINEIIEHQKNGLLVPRGDVAALSSALLEVLSDNTWAIKAKREGPKVIRDKFSVEAHVKKTLDVYTKCIAQSCMHVGKQQRIVI